MLYHEAAGVSGDAPGPGGLTKRIQLLQEAAQHATLATEQAPNSLSCAALRATLAINLLVEESAQLVPSSGTVPEPKLTIGADEPQQALALQQPPAPAGGSGRKRSSAERKCAELRQRFRGAISACSAALNSANPALYEPVITITSPTHTTCDPCSLVSAVHKLWSAGPCKQLARLAAILTAAPAGARPPTDDGVAVGGNCQPVP